ncbi:MAG TPA: hypothetical protein VFJ57_00945 [Solirubrobacterales bacterium]|nr:hypothetical protein [Solirubrobacterales bacterium]
MSLKLGGLGVALAVACVLAAVAAPAASAEGHYVCEVSPCIATGESVGNVTFTTGSGSRTCTGTMQGTTGSKEGTTGRGTLHAVSCPGGSLKMNHCAFAPGNTTKEGAAPVSIECAEGNSIEYSVSVSGVTVCTLKYGPQTISEAVHYTNVENKVTVEGEASVTATSKSGSKCSEVPSTSEVSGKSLVTCYEDKGKETTGTETTTPASTSLGKEVGCYVEE